jgi:hypothetical protein
LGKPTRWKYVKLGCDRTKEDEMQYMVEWSYTKDHRDAALAYFLEHGATHYEARVTVKDAWFATQDMIAYALVEGEDGEAVAEACASLEKFGEVSYRRVTSSEEL